MPVPKSFPARIYQVRLIPLIFVAAGLYYLLIPKAIAALYPCLSNVKDHSYSFDQCTLTGIMDRFLVISLTGLIGFCLAGYSLNAQYKYRHAIVTGVFCALLTIAQYYWYLPVVDKLVNQTPIYINP